MYECADYFAFLVCNSTECEVPPKLIHLVFHIGEYIGGFPLREEIVHKVWDLLARGVSGRV